MAYLYTPLQLKLHRYFLTKMLGKSLSIHNTIEKISANMKKI